RIWRRRLPRRRLARRRLGRRLPRRRLARRRLGLSGRLGLSPRLGRRLGLGRRRARGRCPDRRCGGVELLPLWLWRLLRRLLSGFVWRLRLWLRRLRPAARLDSRSLWLAAGL